MIQIQWPNIFSSNHTNLTYDKDSTAQDLKLLLQSEKGELWGDPGYGIRLRRFLYDQNSTYLTSLIREQIYDAIKLYIPQIAVNKEDITFLKNKTTLYITIPYIFVIDNSEQELTTTLLEG